jgi:Salmonella virulence plasmid 65kDa B protein
MVFFRLAGLARSLTSSTRSKFAVALLGLACVAWLGVANANGMHTGHQFAVSDGGAATISVPIQIPRGVAGMEPQLSMVYSSSGSNGPMGLGWSLAGPSAITRCGKTIQHDGVRGIVSHSIADRFCLDGQRLVTATASTDATYHPTASTTREYFLERDNFSKIVATGDAASQTTGAPVSFKVYTKAGLVLDYGLSANSRALTRFADPVATPNVVHAWHVQRISDRMAIPNSVEYVYCAGDVSVSGAACDPTFYPGFLSLHYIRYTDRGAASTSPSLGNLAVMLSYETRPDRRVGYSAGSLVSQTLRIAHVSTFIGFSSILAPGTRVRTYEMTYEPTKVGTTPVRLTNVSRLTQIQELQGGVTSLTRPPPPRTSAADAMPPLVFTYPEDSIHGVVGGAPNVAAPVIPRGCGGPAGSRTAQLCP